MVARSMDRRAFLRAAGSGFAASLLPGQVMALAIADSVFASGFRGPDGSFGIATLTERGEVIDRHLLPARCHGLAYGPASGEVAAFARRPGTFAAIFSKNHEPVIITAPEGRHYFGHGCFSRDGKLLYASENDFDNNCGVIGLYDARNNYARIGEFSAGGIGTHDLTISEDGATLVVANGGIATHPDFDRTKLNLDHMQPSMVLLEAGSGRMIEKHPMPDELRQLSTRHADLDAKGRIWFACQYEGPRNDRPPVIGVFSKGEDIKFVTLPDAIADSMGNYIGAISVNRADGLVAATSPKGGAYVILDAKDGSVVDHHLLAGVSGVAPARPGFVFSSLDGNFAGHMSPRADPFAWDQHIVRMT